MKFIPLIWSGIGRQPLRTALLLLQITIAFVLFGALNGMNVALQQAMAAQRADVLYVTAKVRGDPLPSNYTRQIEAIPGVLITNPQNYLAGSYQHPSQFVVAVATDPTRYFAINTYCSVRREQVIALEKTRTGAIIGAELARKYGWKPGDRIPLNTEVPRKNGSVTWIFDVVGIYEYPDEPDAANLIIMNNEYFDQARADRQSSGVARFVLKIADAADAPDVIDAIDAQFANSPHETESFSERESGQARLQSLGDLDSVARAVTATVFLALLISTGTMLMNSIRQRTTEIGVLKAIGFSNRTVVSLVAVEVIAICLAAAAMGLVIAWRLLPFARENTELLKMPLLVAMPPTTVAAGLLCALTLGIVCAALPARYALRLRVIQALARRA